MGTPGRGRKPGDGGPEGGDAVVGRASAPPTGRDREGTHGSLCIAPPQGHCMRCPSPGAVQSMRCGCQRRQSKGTNTGFADAEGCFCALPLASEQVGRSSTQTAAGGRAAARWPTRGAIQRRGPWAIGGSGRARTHASRTLKAAFVPFHSPASAFTTTRSGPRGRRGPRPTAQPSDRSRDHLRSARARE